jgi:hypothetical protein
LKTKLSIILLTCIVIFIISCSKNSGGDPTPTDPCGGLSFKFSTDVQPIFNTTCANSSNCHGAGSANSGGPFTDYNLIFAKRAEIKFQVSGGFMPKVGSITADQKNKIICWINSGAPNN